jgi:hypothetical protein
MPIGKDIFKTLSKKIEDKYRRIKEVAEAEGGPKPPAKVDNYKVNKPIVAKPNNIMVSQKKVILEEDIQIANTKKANKKKMSGNPNENRVKFPVIKNISKMSKNTKDRKSL